MNMSLQQAQNLAKKNEIWTPSMLTKSDKLTIINSLRNNSFMAIREIAFYLVHFVSKDKIRIYLKSTGYIIYNYLFFVI